MRAQVDVYFFATKQLALSLSFLRGLCFFVIITTIMLLLLLPLMMMTTTIMFSLVSRFRRRPLVTGRVRTNFIFLKRASYRQADKLNFNLAPVLDNKYYCWPSDFLPRPSCMRGQLIFLSSPPPPRLAPSLFAHSRLCHQKPNSV